MERDDIEFNVQKYYNNSGPDNRYASFDYCYNHFRTTEDLEQDMERSCLLLGFYLASWGMYRGSSELLQRSIRHYVPTIQYINRLEKSVWDIDVDKYDDNKCRTILKIYDDLIGKIIPYGHAHTTLITKTLMGVFGFIPAFDNYFKDTFSIIYFGDCGFTTVNLRALQCIKSFYEANKAEIDRLSSQMFTYDFNTGNKTNIRYPKAKIIDMYGWQRAMN